MTCCQFFLMKLLSTHCGYSAEIIFFNQLKTHHKMQQMTKLTSAVDQSRSLHCGKGKSRGHGGRRYPEAGVGSPINEPRSTARSPKLLPMLPIFLGARFDSLILVSNSVLRSWLYATMILTIESTTRIIQGLEGQHHR